MPSVWNGAKDHYTASEPEIKRPGHAPSSQGRSSALADRAKSLIDFGRSYNVGETYFRADWFCKYSHDRILDRKAIRQLAVDRASGTNDGPVVAVLDRELRLYRRPSPRTLVQINDDLVTGSSSSLSRSSLSTLPSEEGRVRLRSRFSVMGSDAGYSDTVDGDYSDFGDAYGVF